MATFQCALVGMHFRPPARQVLAVLPLSTELELRRAADNPYDPNAVEVWASPARLPEMDAEEIEAFDAKLAAAGSSLDELLVQDALQLGFLSASANLIEPGQSSNQVIAEALDEGKLVAASLTVSLSGKASVLCRVEGE